MIKNNEINIILEYEPATDEEDSLLQIYEYLFNDLMMEEDIDNISNITTQYYIPINKLYDFKNLIKSISYIRIDNN